MRTGQNQPGARLRGKKYALERDHFTKSICIRRAVRKNVKDYWTNERLKPWVHGTHSLYQHAAMVGIEIFEISIDHITRPGMSAPYCRQSPRDKISEQILKRNFYSYKVELRATMTQILFQTKTRVLCKKVAPITPSSTHLNQPRILRHRLFDMVRERQQPSTLIFIVLLQAQKPCILTQIITSQDPLIRVRIQL